MVAGSGPCRSTPPKRPSPSKHDQTTKVGRQGHFFDNHSQEVSVHNLFDVPAFEANLEVGFSRMPLLGPYPRRS